MRSEAVVLVSPFVEIDKLLDRYQKIVVDLADALLSPYEANVVMSDLLSQFRRAPLAAAADWQNGRLRRCAQALSRSVVATVHRGRTPLRGRFSTKHAHAHYL